MTTASLAARALEEGSGILRLAPAWVPRSFCRPGKRIKLNPDDYFVLGGARGGIDERWLSSTVKADNGPGTGSIEGMNEVVIGDDDARLLLAEVVEELGADLIGPRLMTEHGGWTMYSKFFDNQGPLPFHVHHDDAHAALVGRVGKPEAYYFPPQMNNHGGDRPFSFFGLHPTVKPDEFTERLAMFGQGDNRITELSQAYRLQPGTGWDIPTGVLHAPGSFCTYEPQRASDVFAMCECMADGRVVDPELLWKDVPSDRHGDYDYVVELLDWDANTDPEFVRNRFMNPVVIRGTAAGVVEKWVVYRSDAFSAKELTVAPGTTAVITDSAAYGVIAVQGHGRLGNWTVETPTLIRYGQLTQDEFFVSETAAAGGVTVVNDSTSEPLVLLKHFGPANPDLGVIG